MSREPLQFELDGRTVHAEGGETILDAARREGVEIPTLCYDPALPLEGGCRMCLVEDAERGPVAACHTLVSSGASIRTSSDRLQRLRQGMLDLMRAEHPDGVSDEVRGTGEMAAVSDQLPGGNGFGAHMEASGSVDASHPYLRFEADRCIVCRRCEHACESVQGQFVYGVGGRGASAGLLFGPADAFAMSDCTACGACVMHCPTGAITDKDRAAEASGLAITRSTCGYCGVGCQIDIAASQDEVVLIDGAPDAAVNHGHLCAKGRYAHAYHRSPDRLTAPLLREGEDFREVSWEEAAAFAAGRMREICDADGADAVGGLASSRSTNEAAYLLQKFMRGVLGTNNVDCCARVCHSSTALALQLVTGTGAASASYEDIDRASCILIAGANPTEAHPVVGARIKQAVLNGTPLIVADPRAIELAEYANVHLQLTPGTNVPCFNAIAKQMVENGRVDGRYLAERTEGFAEFEAFLRDQSIEDLCASAGVDSADVDTVASMLAEHGPVLFVHGLGLSELTQGTESIMALCNLGMLSGSIGRPGAGMLPLRGQNNVQGAADMGAAPTFMTGYLAMGDPEVQARVSDVWGIAPPTKPGLTTTEMLDAAAEGTLKGLWAVGEDLAHSDPYEERTLKALENLDLLIVQDIFFCETAKYAHLVLPAAATVENDGTYTNGERRIQRVRPAVRAPGMALPDWEIIRNVANAADAGWDYATPAEVMVEIGQVAPRLFGGVRYERLEGDAALQWPCPDEEHPGTACVHSDGFLRGKGLLSALEYVPSPERTSEEFPMVLVTGRVLQQYNVGTMTQRTPNRTLAASDELELHPSDADMLGVSAATDVIVTSQWGRTTVPAKVTERVAPGECFLSFHYADSHTNRLVGPHVDPMSKCPEYKRVAVRVEVESR